MRAVDRQYIYLSQPIHVAQSSGLGSVLGHGGVGSEIWTGVTFSFCDRGVIGKDFNSLLDVGELH